MASDTDDQIFGGTAEAVIYGLEFFRIDPDKTALLVIDMQRGFLDEDSVYKAPKGGEIISNIDAIIGSARERGIPIIWTQTDHSFPGGGIVLKKHPRIVNTKEFWKGHESFDIYPHMTQPRDDEYRVVKHKYDAFHETDLDALLRNLDKDTIIIVGVATEVCCESTARAGFFHDYQIIFARDATAAFDPGVQEEVCNRIDTLFGRAMTTDAIIDALGGSEIDS